MAKSKKKKKKANTTLIVVVLIVVIVGVFIYRKSLKPNETPTPPSVKTSGVDMTKTLKDGSEGEEVSSLQRKLNQKGATLDVDGIFGSKTLKSLQDYYGVNQINLNTV